MQNFLSSRNETQKRFFHKHKNAQKYFVRFEVCVIRIEFFYSRYGNRETQRAHGTAKRTKSKEPRAKNQEQRTKSKEPRTKSKKPRTKSKDKRQLDPQPFKPQTLQTSNPSNLKPFKPQTLQTSNSSTSLTSLLYIEQAILHRLRFSVQNRGFLIIRGLREQYRLCQYSECHLFVQLR